MPYQFLKLQRMKIKLLKNHVLGGKNETIEVLNQRGKYLVAMGVGLEWKEGTEVKKKEVEKETVKKVILNGSNNKKRTANKK